MAHTFMVEWDLIPIILFLGTTKWTVLWGIILTSQAVILLIRLSWLSERSKNKTIADLTKVLDVVLNSHKRD